MREVIDSEIVKKQKRKQIEKSYSSSSPSSQNSNKNYLKPKDVCICKSSESAEINSTYYQKHPPPMPYPIIEIALCRKKPEFAALCTCDSEDSCQGLGQMKSCPVLGSKTKAKTSKESCEKPAPCQEPAPCTLGKRPCDESTPCQEPPPCSTGPTESFQPPVCARRRKAPCGTCQETRNLKANISKCSDIKRMLELLKNAALHLQVFYFTLLNYFYYFISSIYFLIIIAMSRL